MFCNQCGKPIEDGKHICDECAAAAAEPVQEETFQLGQTDAPAVSRKKPGKGMIAGIIAIVIVAVAGLVAALNWDSISNTLALSFSSHEEYVQDVQQEALDDGIDVLGDAYGSMKENMDTASGNQSAAGKADIHLQVGDSLITLLEQSVTRGEMELDWLSDILLELDANTNANKGQVDMGIGLGDDRIVTASVFMDMENSVLYMGVPEMNDTYLKLDINALYGSTGTPDFNTMMKENQKAMEKLGKTMPDEKTMEKTMSKYVAILLSHIEEVEKSKKTVKLGDVEQKLVVLSFRITEEQLAEAVVEMLEELQDDEVMLDMIVGFMEYSYSVSPAGEYQWNETTQTYEFVAVEYTTQELRQMLDESIQEAISQMKENAKNADPENYIDVKAYVDGKGNIAGYEFQDNYGESIHFLTVRKGSKFAFEADLAGVLIEGTGVTNRGKTDAHYTVTVEGEEILELEVADWDEDMAEEGYPCGTLRLTLGDDTVRDLEESLEGSELGTLLNAADFVVELKLDSSKTHSKTELNLNNGSTLLVGLSIETTEEAASAVTMPEDVVDFTDMDQSKLMAWVGDLDFDTVIGNMDAAGVPDELTDYLEAIEVALKQQG